MSPYSARLRLRNLSVRFGRKVVLTNLSFDAAEGEVVAILGENGSGKTTLARVLAGLQPLSAGQIFVDDHDITHLPPWHRSRRGMRLVPQRDRVFQELTVADNVRVCRGKLQTLPTLIANAAWLREAWHLPAGNLSGGRQSLLALAIAMSVALQVLILDEPAAGLDDQTIGTAATLIRDASSRGETVVVFEHRQAFTRLVATREATLVEGCLH